MGVAAFIFQMVFTARIHRRLGVGFAMRVFLRMVALVVGMSFIILLFAGWLGWVEIQWDVIQGQMDPLMAGLSEQFDSFQAFVRGSIPSTGLGALGLFTGVKRQ